MIRLTWYSEPVREPYCKELNLERLKGRKYNLSAGEKNGYVIYNDEGYYKTNCTVAFGKFDDIELTLKKEGNFFNSRINIYTKKDNTLIGRIGDDFIYRNFKLSTDFSTRNFFYKNDGFDLRYAVYKGRSSTVITFFANKIKKRWHQSVYTADIQGMLDLQDDLNWEFILCCFFALHNYLQFERYSD